MVHLEMVERMEFLSADVVRMVLSSEHLAQTTLPGQFVNVRCGDSWQAYLRRPLSVCDVRRETGAVDLVFQLKGEGTRRLAQLKPGERVDLMGPLGSAFSPCKPGSRIVVVGGGIGTFPLLYLLRSMPEVHRTALLGFRSRSAVVLQEAFSNQSDQLSIATDDGSYGTSGFVTGLLEQRLLESPVDKVYVCGPLAMMKAVVNLCLEQNVAVEVSMEQRMGCGVGACLVCACKKHAGEDDFTYTHVCREGPIFNGRDLIFD